jgi:hypothetical protein
MQALWHEKEQEWDERDTMSNKVEHGGNLQEQVKI